MRTGNIKIAGAKISPKSMTVTERDALGIPSMGTVIFNTTTNYLEYWRGTTAGWTQCTDNNYTVIAGDGIGITPTPVGTAIYLLDPPTAPVIFSAARSKAITLGTANIPVTLRSWFYEADPTSQFDPSSGIFTAPEAGYYNFSGCITLECTNAPASNIVVPFGIFSNNSGAMQNMGNYAVLKPTLDQCPQYSITRTFYCAVGDQVSFRIYYPPAYMDMVLYHGTSLGVWESWFSGFKIK
jgi:hypothetical protein